MNLGMAENPNRVVLDTNILISAIGFGGKPRQILVQALEKKVQAVTSPILFAELYEVVCKKFPKLEPKLLAIEKKIKKNFTMVHPKKSLNISKDEDDNRVLEAAVEGICNYIVTGDRELLDLASFKNIKIITADQFLNILEGIN